MICVLCIISFDVGTILGYNLTDTDSMKNQYEYLYSSSLEKLTSYVRLLVVGIIYLLVCHVGHS